MSDLPDQPNPAPLIEVRIRDLHLTVQRLPVPLLTFLTTLAGSAGASLWLNR